MRGIVTLCGSTRFREQFEEVNRRLTWSGWVVLSVGSFHHSEKDHDIAGQIIARKKKLDILHKEKIAMSQAIVVIAGDGKPVLQGGSDYYVGESTASEIAHAEKLGKKIYWYRPFSAYNDWEQLLDESSDDLEAASKDREAGAK